MINIKNVSKVSKVASNMLSHILPKRDNVRFYVTTKEAVKGWDWWLKGSSGNIAGTHFLLDGDADDIKNAVDKFAAEHPGCMIDAVIQAKKV